jgi:hypothetical protein
VGSRSSPLRQKLNFGYQDSDICGGITTGLWFPLFLMRIVGLGDYSEDAQIFGITE